MKHIFYFIFYVLILLQDANAQTTAIPDSIFEQKLINLGIDSDGLVNGQILNSDAAAVTALEVKNADIMDLTGIEAFVNLVNLNCSGNWFTTLNLTNNPNLEVLDCSVNDSLSTLDISNNLLLKELFCHYNNLSNLDITNHTALVKVRCQHNQLSSLDITNNLILKELGCGNNNLSNLDISNNLGLTSLHCGSNNLTSLDVTNHTALESLSCGRNNLGSIDVSNNLALILLHCYNANLSTLDISNNLLLETLSCFDNNLGSLDISNNLALKNLGCSYTNINSLDVTNHTALTSLHCYNNSINYLDVSNNIALTNLVCSNNNLRRLDVSNNTMLDYLACSNLKLTKLDLTNNPLIKYLHCVNNLPHLQICIAANHQPINHALWIKDPSAIYLENCTQLVVKGRITIDDNSNCVTDSLEEGFTGRLLKFERVTDATVFYATTYDSLGNYEACLDTGTYTVTVIPSEPYWQVCPSSQQVTVDANYTLQTLNWSLQELVSCAWLEVDIAAPLLRMTGGGSAYTVFYCNNGSVAAQNAYVEVDLDADLNFVSSTIPVANQNGTVYTFNVGTVDVGECGSFNIQVLVDTSALFQQTHCTEVYMYPDSICAPMWTGPRLDGNANCQNDSVFFLVQNIGGVMQQQQPYTIFEDNIAMRTGNVQLGTGQSTIIAQAATVGKTYRIEVLQVPGFPSFLGNLVFSRVIEGCNPFSNGSFNTGFVTQFSNGHSAPFMAIDCQENVGSYDPNDKAAQPAGYGVPHYIEQNIALDYKIRFQNTGTDTAFNIVILDTLSSYVDIASLQMGASSHAYTWSIEGGHVLRVNFANIMLVDSNANEPLSHGFFRYRIDQKTNNPLGSVIENQAAIYFDYNPPIFTNTTFHTVGENFIASSVSIDKIYQEGVQVTASPNPFVQTTTIKIEGKEYQKLELAVFDISGRTVAQIETAFNHQIELRRGKLEVGIYFYQLKGDGELLNTGKIVVQQQ